MKRRLALQAFGIVALTCAAYAPGLNAPFFDHWDDDFYVTGNPRTLGEGWGAFTRLWNSRDTWDGSYLEFFPLRDTVYWATHQLFGTRVLAFHLVNLLAHLIATLLVWRLARRLGFSEWVAVVSAALFGVHPVHVESVVWVAALKDPLFTALMVASLLAFLRYRETQRPVQYALYVGLMVASLLCKSLALGTPLLAMALDRALEPKAAWKTAFARQLGPGVIAAGFLVQFLLIGKMHGVIIPPHGGSWAQHYLLMAWALARYLQQAVSPVSFQIYYCFENFSGFDLRLAGIVAMAAAVGFTLSRRNAPRVRLLAIWFLVCLAPVANLIPFPSIMADRYLYAPSIAACVALAWGLDLLPGRLRRALPAALILVFAVTTFARALVWRDEVNLWAEATADTACQKERSTVATLMFVFQARHTKAPADAVGLYRQVLTHPGFQLLVGADQASILSDGSAVALKAGQPELARSWVDRAIDAAPWSSTPWLAKSRLPGEPGAALEAARRAVKLEPTSEAHLQLGMMLVAGGAMDEGVEHVAMAINLKPRLQCPRLLSTFSRAPADVRPRLEPLRQACEQLMARQR